MLICPVNPKLRQYQLLHLLLRLSLKVYSEMPGKGTDCFSSLHYFGTLSPPLFPEMFFLPRDFENDMHMWYL